MNKVNQVQHSVNKGSVFGIADMQKAASRLAHSDTLVAQVRAIRTSGIGMLIRPKAA